MAGELAAAKELAYVDSCNHALRVKACMSCEGERRRYTSPRKGCSLNLEGMAERQPHPLNSCGTREVHNDNLHTVHQFHYASSMVA